MILSDVDGDEQLISPELTDSIQLNQRLKRTTSMPDAERMVHPDDDDEKRKKIPLNTK